MIEALLHGKLSREQENMEDLLTSSVFGMLQYVSAELGLFKFLSKAAIGAGIYPLAGLSERCVIHRDSIRYSFWPFWPGSNGEPGCEPDVVLHIPCDDGSFYLIGIEAKFRSGKSSDAEDEIDHPTDQLAREWHSLFKRASDLGAQPVLVYLTADVSLPSDQIKSSLRDCCKRTAGPTEPVIAWLSWRHLPRLFRRSPDRHLSDLASMAKRMNLTFYEGITRVTPIRVDWHFKGTTAESYGNIQRKLGTTKSPRPVSQRLRPWLSRSTSVATATPCGRDW